jgi:phospholipase A1
MYKFSLILFLLSSIAFGQENENDTIIITKTYSQRWELNDADKNGTFRLMSYKPIYITAGRIVGKAEAFN